MSISLPGTRAAQRLAATWPALLPVLLFLPMLVAPPVNHDVAAVFSFAERWLDGERLYVDLIDVNPPLIFLLNLIPAALARATGLDGVGVLLACLIALGFAVWRLATAVRDRAREGAVERVVLDVLPGLAAFGAGYDFGQREALMAALALPYLLAAARRIGGEMPRHAILAAAVAAIGFALKPHFLVVPALVEAAVLAAAWRRGAGRAGDRVAWTMAALWLLYLPVLLLAFPAYLDTVVPMAAQYYLVFGGQTPWSLLLIPRFGSAVLLVLPLAVLAWRQPAPLPRVLALAALGALVSALVQHKGWSYHILPIELFGCALAAVLAARWLDRLRAGPSLRAAARAAAVLVALCALTLVSRGEAPWNQLAWRKSDAHALARILGEVAPGGRVLVLSPGIAPVYPALTYAGARMTLRGMTLWLLEGAYAACPAGGGRYRDPAAMTPAESYLFRSVAEDFARAPPDAVVIDSLTAIPDCDGVAFDLLAYFTRHTLFAETWPRYAEVARHGRLTIHARRN